MTGFGPLVVQGPCTWAYTRKGPVAHKYNHFLLPILLQDEGPLAHKLFQNKKYSQRPTRIYTLSFLVRPTRICTFQL